MRGSMVEGGCVKEKQKLYIRKDGALHPSRWHQVSQPGSETVTSRKVVSLVLVIHMRTLPHVVDTVKENLLTMG